MNNHKFIGGFFELALPEMGYSKTLAEYLALPDDPSLLFTSARSALAALLKVMQPKRAWIPSYVCQSVIDAFTLANVQINFYRVGDKLEPDVIQLDQKAALGDCVLGINYFGRPPSIKFLNFVKKRNDLVFIEDCCQSLDTQQKPWGNWRLFSPRKLAGVADGGYIISQKGGTLKIDPSITIDPGKLWTAALHRFCDTDGLDNLSWHTANQEREKAINISNARMSRLSYELLKRLNGATIIKKRKDNFKVLYKNLSSVAFLSNADPDFCPFGFPIRLNKNLRTLLNKALITEGIFPAIHWPTLPSPISQFPTEHLLSEELMTLPCDQRYDSSEMEFLAQVILNFLNKNI